MGGAPREAASRAIREARSQLPQPESQLHQQVLSIAAADRQVLATEECEFLVAATGPLHLTKTTSKSQVQELRPLPLKGPLWLLLPVGLEANKNGGLSSSRPSCIVGVIPV